VTITSKKEKIRRHDAFVYEYIQAMYKNACKIHIYLRCRNNRIGENIPENKYFLGET
jgi:hypothetical protein